MGALEVQKMIHGRHQAWRLLSCMWLHAGVFHVLANMLSLVFIGIRLEQEFGFGMHLFFHLDMWCNAFVVKLQICSETQSRRQKLSSKNTNNF